MSGREEAGVERIRVLVVDSSEEVSHLLLALFDREGFATVLVPHGAEAMELIDSGAAGDFHAIIVQCSPVSSPVDPSLPMGLAFLDSLVRSTESLERTILLTTMAGRLLPPELARSCKVITQPFDIHDLVNAVRICAGAPA